jgi:hypothetical protein
MTIMEERGGEREKNNIVTCEETHKKTSSARRETMIPLLSPLRLISSPKLLSKRSFQRPWGRASAAGKSLRKWHDKACGGARKEGRKERKREGKKDVRRRRESFLP